MLILIYSPRGVHRKATPGAASKDHGFRWTPATRQRDNNRHVDGDCSPKRSFRSIHNAFAGVLAENRSNSVCMRRFRDNRVRAITEFRRKFQQFKSILEFELRNFRLEHR